MSENNQIRVGQKVIRFNTPVKDVLVVDEITLVLLQRFGIAMEGQEQFNRNILAYDSNGKQLWIIQESPFRRQGSKPYTSIYKEGGKIIAYNALGLEYILDLKSGTVSPSGNRPW